MKGPKSEKDASRKGCWRKPLRVITNKERASKRRKRELKEKEKDSNIGIAWVPRLLLFIGSPNGPDSKEKKSQSLDVINKW